MALRHILIAGVAMTTLSGGALAGDYYRCNDRSCYDDQAEETRRLNQMQLENPGAGLDAVPEPDDADGQGGPYYESPDDVAPSDDMDRGGPPPDTDAYPNGDGDDNYGPPPDDDDEPDDRDDDQYPDDGR